MTELNYDHVNKADLNSPTHAAAVFLLIIQMHTSLHALALNMHVLKRQTCVFSDLILGTAERLISLVTVNDLKPANALSATQTEPLG